MGFQGTAPLLPPPRPISLGSPKKKAKKKGGLLGSLTHTLDCQKKVWGRDLPSHKQEEFDIMQLAEFLFI